MTLLLPEPTTTPTIAAGTMRHKASSPASSPYIATSRRILIEAEIAPPWIAAVERRINELLLLPPGWDTYGAQPITVENVLLALSLLERLVDLDSPAPIIVPTVAGGIQMEWEFDRTAVEVRVDEGGAWFFVGDDSGEHEGPASADLSARAARVIAAVPYST
ncbi:MAG: hypothetical protein MSC31_14340 [Solirubrobacteraceae bacterium MAG38_C4-C5]|nr:hypothetical protein [Candidatus Siliceabacter maunaloa]